MSSRTLFQKRERGACPPAHCQVFHRFWLPASRFAALVTIRSGRQAVQKNGAEMENNWAERRRFVVRVGGGACRACWFGGGSCQLFVGSMRLFLPIVSIGEPTIRTGRQAVQKNGAEMENRWLERWTSDMSVCRHGAIAGSIWAPGPTPMGVDRGENVRLVPLVMVIGASMIRPGGGNGAMGCCRGMGRVVQALGHHRRCVWRGGLCSCRVCVLRWSCCVRCLGISISMSRGRV